MSRARALLLLLLPLCVLACGGEAASRGPDSPQVGQPPPAPVAFVTTEPDAPLDDEAEVQPEQFVAGGPVPIDADDAVWGSRGAPVTMVAFIDYQCPYTKRAWGVLHELSRRYGDELRIVLKHHPLPFHKQAKPAAVMAQAVLELGGVGAFLRFSDQAFEHQAGMNESDLEVWAAAAGVPVRRVHSAVSDPLHTSAVENDMALAERLGERGTPAFLINGVRVRGAQPLEKFVEVIDQEVPAARAAQNGGLSDGQLYEQRVMANLGPAETSPSRSNTASAPDLAIYRVPVGKSPTQGPADALVTIVEFAGFQCPYCQRVQATLEQLRQKYPKQIRIVFKHYPMPFHQRALPAANLAIYAYRTGGSPKFFAVADLLWHSSSDLSDAALERIAKQVGLNSRAAMAAVNSSRYQAVFDEDAKLVKDLKVTGTPQFFINGRRLTGARRLAEFVEVIDAQLGEAYAMVQTGTPRSQVYAQIMKGASGIAPPPRRKVGPIPTNSPSIGPKNAPVVMQIFGNFECPFTARVWNTVQQVRAAYPRQVRLVWRHFPLPMHQHAERAAEAAIEVQRQHGDKAFWKMAGVLFANNGHLTDPDLEAYATKLGVDLNRYQAAMSGGVHRPTIVVDRTAAAAAGLKGTPAFLINGYYLGGAQPLSEFRKVIDYALQHPAPTKPGGGP